MIPTFDYLPLHRRMSSEINEAIERVLVSGRLILGPEVEAFEREFAKWVGVSAAVGVASGTDALILALRALGVGPGDEVITVANCGVPPIVAIRATGAVPRLVDVLPGTLLIDPAALAGALTEQTRCVLPVHLYGQAADMAPILEFAKRHDLRVVEDCAQAHGATYDGRHVGGFGDVGCFSFYPTKNLGAYGDGGLCVTGNAEIDNRLRMLRMYGFRGDVHAHCEGINSRLDELQAAILRVKLRHLDPTIDERRQVARRYIEGLDGSSYQPVLESSKSRHAYHLFVVRVADRAALCAALSARGVGYGIHYPEPVHRMEAYRSLEPAGGLPVSERACAAVLSLPLYPGLGNDSIDRVLDVLRAADASG